MNFACFLKKIWIKFVFSISSHKRYPNLVQKYLGVHIGEGCEIYKSADSGTEPYLIFIGNHVRINSGVHFINHDGGCWVPRYQSERFSDIDKINVIKVGNNVHIGTNSFIMPGVSIGNNVIVGCGSIVTHNVPDNVVVAGVPARIIETLDEYIKKNETRFLYTKNMKPGKKRKYLEQHFLDIFNEQN